MVKDVSKYFERYTSSRMEPPSLLVTPEGLQSYLHLSVGELAQSLHSLSSEDSKRKYSDGKIDDEETTSGSGKSDQLETR